jgi:hypothetical protein
LARDLGEQGQLAGRAEHHGGFLDQASRVVGHAGETLGGHADDRHVRGLAVRHGA